MAFAAAPRYPISGFNNTPGSTQEIDIGTPVAGELIVFIVSIDANSTDDQFDAITQGYIKAKIGLASGQSFQPVVYFKVAGEDEANPVITAGISQEWAWAGGVWPGGDAAAILETLGAPFASNTSTSGTVVAPSETSLTDGALAISFGACDFRESGNPPMELVAPLNFGNLVTSDGSGAVRVGMASRIIAVPGASGTQEWSSAGDEQTAATTLIFKAGSSASPSDSSWLTRKTTRGMYRGMGN